MPTALAQAQRPGLFSWWRATDAAAHRALVAASLGWMFAEWIVAKKPSVLGMISGAVAGLVAGQTHRATELQADLASSSFAI